MFGWNKRLFFKTGGPWLEEDMKLIDSKHKKPFSGEPVAIDWYK
jgi:hypothetical protein